MKLYLPKTTVAIAVLAAAGAHAAPQPAGATATQARPSYSFSAMTSVRYATPNPRTSSVTTYMPPASMSAILPPKLVTTTWKNGVDASDWDNPYGQAEWNRRWVPFMPNISISIFSLSTTVAPTPIPSTSLILPPDSGFLYGALEPNMTFPSHFIFGDLVICGIYINEAVRALKLIIKVRGREGRKVIIHLLWVNILVVFLNILLLLTEYKLHYIQVSFTTVVYSIKLKLEFAMLNRLRSLTRTNPCVCQQEPTQRR
ncbi:hypothetical protein N7510_005158 [Penicillium lagena]|uniref:uncharacterized protein n=1 Tax=Penicillium lagena TaxID=94218 RepID=UPI0025400680|nr:uncharacterized protein N7510_005158 [Penicillium lagena]KAJ5621174.1 hypothetical protein N7510_005158 [Penicillium lagena]